MTTSFFVFELGCEELPSSALPSLNSQLHSLFKEKLISASLGFSDISVIASPRRVGAVISGVAQQSDNKALERRGPAHSAAYINGAPTKALKGFCKGLGIEPEQTSSIKTEKGHWIVYQGVEDGQDASVVLAQVCSDVIQSLALSKPMRWGSSRDEFARPVHWILAMLNERIVPITIFGLNSGNTTFGHRFMAPAELVIDHASNYEKILNQAFVIANFHARTDKTWEVIQKTAEIHDVWVDQDDALLTEITCLVEWPVALCGKFEEKFLSTPDIALIAAMKGHQKYFPTRAQTGELTNRFIIVSNIESTDESQVIAGNQRVIRARLSDAKFFYDTDRKHTLRSRRDRLNKITFHPKLGSLGEKTERLKKLSGQIAGSIGVDTNIMHQAAELSRCDLVSEMVLEFDELQGRIGTLYATLEQENPDVAQAIQGLYRPKGASDNVPDDLFGAILALADRLDTLAGLFAIDQPPTGSKDPFALRRAAIGLLRLNERLEFNLDLEPWVSEAFNAQPIKGAPDALKALVQFIGDRERVRLLELGYRHDIVMAVQAINKLNTAATEARVKVLTEQANSDGFAVLISANKRVANLLKQGDTEPCTVNPSLFEHPSENALFQTAARIYQDVGSAVSRETYTEALGYLLSMKPKTDAFFDHVMVNSENTEIRKNRLGICQLVKDAYEQLADFSLIQQ
ncbi:MAG: glycine--tRNA ligase subunit beta [Gammaproteobacteria bacterium]|nr:glycine--tRNA ligase subunit beta [Gammaproteobacteria bacterium]|tara:strand:+ start:360 stop:2420 length:2061 start_codon:yes stop_codon:yes gene_type:complete